MVAPYATALAAMVEPRGRACATSRASRRRRPRRATASTRRSTTRAARLPEGQTRAVVHAYMAHHQGMTLRRARQRRSTCATAPCARASTPSPLRPGDRAAAPGAHAARRRGRPPARRGGGGRGAVRRPDAAGGAALHTRRTTPSPAPTCCRNGRYAVMLTAAGLGLQPLAATSPSPAGARTRRATPGAASSSCATSQSGAVWSAGYQPSGAEPGPLRGRASPRTAPRSRAATAPSPATLEVVVSPEDDAEVRRVSLTNHGPRAREIELTSYAEIVLAPPAADARPPGLLEPVRARPSASPASARCSPRAGRAPRTSRRSGPRTSRGRSRARRVGPACSTRPTARASSAAAAASATPLSVIDGRAALEHRRRRCSIRSSACAAGCASPPGAHGARHLHDPGRAVARGGARPRRQVPRPGAPSSAPRRWPGRRRRCSSATSASTPDEANLFQRLASRVLYLRPVAARPRRRAARATRGAPRRSGPHGISGDLPIVLVRIDEIDDLGIVRQLLHAHEYWRIKGLAVDLVILNERGASYVQDLQDALEALVRTSQSTPAPRGGTSRAAASSSCARDLIAPEARDAAAGRRPASVLLAPTRHASPSSSSACSRARRCRRRAPRRAPARAAGPRRAAARRPPRPDARVLQRPRRLRRRRPRVRDRPRRRAVDAGALDQRRSPTPASASRSPSRAPATPGRATAARTSSRRGRTIRSAIRRARPSTSATRRPASSGRRRALPIREEAWPYVARHGQGYSRFEHAAHGIALELLQFVPLADPVKISPADASRNRSGRAAPAVGRPPTSNGCSAPSRGAPRAVRRHRARRRRPARCSRATPGTRRSPAASPSPTSAAAQTAWTGDRTEFLGRNGTLDASRRRSAGGAACPAASAPASTPARALQTRDRARAAASATEIVFLLGAGATTPDEARDARRALPRGRSRRRPRRGDAAPGTTCSARVQVKTPDRAMDLLLNRWLLYQTLACRVWARSAFYQASGAYGFRDQLQDVHGAGPSRGPSVARDADPARRRRGSSSRATCSTGGTRRPGQGVRTRISDDLLWLPFVVRHYVDATGDAALLDEQVPFLEGAAAAARTRTTPTSCPTVSRRAGHALRALRPRPRPRLAARARTACR